MNINTWHTATPEPGSMASMLVISSVETTTSSNTGTLPPTRPVLPPCRDGGCCDKCDEFSDQHLGTDGELPGGAVGEDAGHLPRVPGPEHAAAGAPHCAQPVLIVLGGALARGQHPTWVTLEGQYTGGRHNECLLTWVENALECLDIVTCQRRKVSSFQIWISLRCKLHWSPTL